ncbi:amino acid racemase [candidate division KSB1 bacterium]|nr:amino acid racemase [candidate division KSB1 bacterium]TDI83456.1 MAG: amino acid racemase [Caldithrix sp.]TDI94242.1 MAG: amino acid racemase [Caldithrix sp.]TDI97738.1 MAG: amino acid racemase [Caldithrix sp.]
MPPKTIGILGGMGPDATALFFQRVIALTPAQCDQEHIPIIINNNPQIPDRTDAILANGENPVPALQDAIIILEKASVDFIFIPCNTVHVYYDEMQRCVDVPIVNLIESVVDDILKRFPDINKVGLLSTLGTIKSGLYHNTLLKHDIELVAPNEVQHDNLQGAIQELKKQSKDTSAIQSLANDLVRAGVQGIILGCTELSLIAKQLILSVPVFDSIEILAEKAVRLAFGGK